MGDCCDSSDASLMLAMLLAVLLASRAIIPAAFVFVLQLVLSCVTRQTVFGQVSLKCIAARCVEHEIWILYLLFLFHYIKDAIFSEVIFYQCSTLPL